MLARTLGRRVLTVSALAAGLGTGAGACDGWLDDPAAHRTISAVAVSPRSVTVPVSTSVFADSVAELSVVARDGSGEPDRRPAARWASSDTTVAQVTPAGIVIGRAPGRAAISATVGGARGWAVVTVVPSVDTGIFVAAHRGFGGVYPENTLVAVDSALTRGADAAEVDIWVTRDSVLMLMHDPTVDRTTNGTGRMSAMTSVQLQALDACSKRGAQWAPCPVPTLRSALRLARRRRGRMVLDLKGPFSRDAFDELFAEVYAAKMQRRVLVTSFDLGMLRAVRRLDADVAVGYLTNGVTPLDSLTGLGRTAALPDEHPLFAAPARARALVDTARRRRIDIGAWTIMRPGEAKTLVSLGVRRLVSDVPLDKPSLTP